MNNRRTFLAGLLSAGFISNATWADIGSPAFLSAGKTRDGLFILCGLSEQGKIMFSVPLPDRGHAAAAHPHKAIAIAFARRPGTFALVLDCVSGKPIIQMLAPEGHHFYGHGAFSQDGRLLFTSENDYEVGQGVVGIWDAQNNYTRIGEFSSGGVGPHDIQAMPNGQTLVVANGGIETHPSSGRAKLNLAEMASNLSYISLSGDLIEQIELSPELQKNSIRHLAVSASGDVAFGTQWQGEWRKELPLIGSHKLGHPVRLFTTRQTEQRQMKGYVASVAVSLDGKRVIATCPQGGLACVHDTKTGTQVEVLYHRDVSGVCYGFSGFLLSTGNGRMIFPETGVVLESSETHWDNHLIRIQKVV